MVRQLYEQSTNQRESDVTLDNIEMIREVLASGLDVEKYLTDDAV